MDTVYTSLKTVGRENDGLVGVMVASLAAAARGYEGKHVAAAISINPQATGQDIVPLFRKVDVQYQNALHLNTLSRMLYLVSCRQS